METTTSVDMYNISDTSIDAEVGTTRLRHATVWLWKLCPPVIFVLGTFGNVMTIVVLRRMSARQSAVSMHVYFTALAVSDLVMLPLNMTHTWALYTFGLDIEGLHDVVCKIYKFSVYVGTMTSAWFLVVMTMQRVTSVMWPHRANVMCTERRMQAGVFVIATLCVLVCAHLIYSFEVTPDKNVDYVCRVSSEKETFLFTTEVYPWLDLILSSFLPFFILAVCNVLLVRKVAQSVQTARTMATVSSAHVSSRQRKASSLTVTLIVTSTAFLILTLPICLCLLYFYVVLKSSPVVTDLFQLLFTVSLLMLSCSTAVNFYLYCLSGTKFRNQFKSIFSKDGKHTATATASTTSDGKQTATGMTSTTNDGKQTTTGMTSTTSDGKQTATGMASTTSVGFKH